MSFKLKKFASIEKSIEECREVVYDNTHEINKSDLLNVLLDSINFVKISDNTVHIDFNKNILLTSNNIVVGARELNIQIGGKRIELNPNLNNSKISKN